MAIQKFLVVGELDGFGKFEVITGGDPVTNYTEHYDGGERTPEHVPSTTTYTDITLERAYVPERDAALTAWHAAFMLGTERPRNVTKNYLNFLGAVTRAETFAECKPVSVVTPDGQAGSNEIAMVRVTLKVTRKL
jgi:phage tail-like protein